MVQSNVQSKRPCKYGRGWKSANARVYLSSETCSLVEWQRLRSKQRLASNNVVATFLLKCNKLLTYSYFFPHTRLWPFRPILHGPFFNLHGTMVAFSFAALCMLARGLVLTKLKCIVTLISPACMFRMKKSNTWLLEEPV